MNASRVCARPDADAGSTPTIIRVQRQDTRPTLGTAEQMSYQLPGLSRLKRSSGNGEEKAAEEEEIVEDKGNEEEQEIGTGVEVY